MHFLYQIPELHYDTNGCSYGFNMGINDPKMAGAEELL